MANAELQYLANAYASGSLSQDVYRMQRAEILDKLSLNLTDNPDSPITLRLKKPKGLNFSTTLSSRDIWIASGIAVFILIVGIGLFLTLPETTNETVAIPTQTPAVVASTSVAPSPEKTAIQETPSVTSNPSGALDIKISSEASIGEIERLTGLLIRDDNWQSNQIDSFQQRWAALPNDIQIQAHNTAWFSQLKYALIKQIAKHRAKASLGDADALVKAEVLSSFARHLGIDSLR